MTKINSKKKKTIKQIPPIKVIIKTLAIIMFIYGFSLTYNMPKKIYGVTWWELGAMAEGHTIENTDAMLKYLEISNIKDLDTNKIDSMTTKAESSLETSLLLTCIYWFTCSALLFIHIPNKNIKIYSNSEEN